MQMSPTIWCGSDSAYAHKHTRAILTLRHNTIWMVNNRCDKIPTNRILLVHSQPALDGYFFFGTILVFCRCPSSTDRINKIPNPRWPQACELRKEVTGKNPVVFHCIHCSFAHVCEIMEMEKVIRTNTKTNISDAAKSVNYCAKWVDRNISQVSVKLFKMSAVLQVFRTLTNTKISVFPVCLLVRWWCTVRKETGPLE